MLYYRILIPAVFCALCSCKSPSEKIVEDFKKINESLEQTNKAYDSLDQKIKLTGLDAVATDSLKDLLDKSYSFMKHLKFQIDSLDPGGYDLDAAENVIIKTPAGDSLYYYTMAIANTAIKYGDSSLKKIYVPMISNDKNTWLRKYFRQVPTVAALTIVSKFEYDIMAIKIAVSRSN